MRSLRQFLAAMATLLGVWLFAIVANLLGHGLHYQMPWAGLGACFLGLAMLVSGAVLARKTPKLFAIVSGVILGTLLVGALSLIATVTGLIIDFWVVDPLETAHDRFFSVGYGSIAAASLLIMARWRSRELSRSRAAPHA